MDPLKDKTTPPTHHAEAGSCRTFRKSGQKPLNSAMFRVRERCQEIHGERHALVCLPCT